MVIEIFYVPCPDAASASGLVSQLISSKLIACGNVISSESMFMWEGALSPENEYIAVMKSIPGLAGKIESEIRKTHPYSIPAILHWTAGCNADYYDWLLSQLENSDSIAT